VYAISSAISRVCYQPRHGITGGSGHSHVKSHVDISAATTIRSRSLSREASDGASPRGDPRGGSSGSLTDSRHSAGPAAPDVGSSLACQISVPSASLHPKPKIMTPEQHAKEGYRKKRGSMIVTVDDADSRGVGMGGMGIGSVDGGGMGGVEEPASFLRLGHGSGGGEGSGGTGGAGGMTGADIQTGGIMLPYDSLPPLRPMGAHPDRPALASSLASGSTGLSPAGSSPPAGVSFYGSPPRTKKELSGHQSPRPSDGYSGISSGNSTGISPNVSKATEMSTHRRTSKSKLRPMGSDSDRESPTAHDSKPHSKRQTTGL
jgi:hypothetical protein